MPSAAVRGPAVGQDHGHGGEREHVVDDGRSAEQALQGGDRRLGPDLAALALEALQHRGLLAADVGAGTDPYVQVEAETAAEHVAAEPAAGIRRVDGGPQHDRRIRVLRPEVDVPLGRAGGEAGDGHPLDQGERVALHQHAVRERATVALIGVAAHELLRTGGVVDRLPLDPGREPGTAATTQPRLGHLGYDPFRAELDRPGQPGHAAVREVVVRVDRIDDADAGERQPLLARQPLDVVGATQAERMVAAVEQSGVHEGVDVRRADRTVRDAADVGRRPPPAVPARASRASRCGRSARRPRGRRRRRRSWPPPRRRRPTWPTRPLVRTR